MNLLKKICTAVFVCSLVACGDSDPNAVVDEDAVQQEKEADAGKKKPFLFQDMKESLDAARAVDKSMQEHHDQQKKELDGI